jgi:PilZ domain
MIGAVTKDERRDYPRVEGAAILWRPAARLNFERRQATNVSGSGIRLHADTPHTAGERLELELFLPDRTQLVCTVEVMWVDVLPLDAPARFDVGMRFVDISYEDRSRLTTLLGG